MKVKISKHCEERFRSRVARTKRMPEIINAAYLYGMPVDELKSSLCRNMIKSGEAIHASSARIYKNVIYWFRGNIAVTVCPLPQALHERK